MYKINKLARLIKSDRKIFHTGDLALLWEIKSKNTLYTAIKRYVKKNILIPIHKGLYATVPLDQLDPLDLGRSVIHRYCYLSTESILSENGVISQGIYSYTYVSDFSGKFTINSLNFLSRRLKKESLYNQLGIIDDDGIFKATLSRAVADMLYFNPKYHFDNKKLINRDEVRLIQKEVYGK